VVALEQGWVTRIDPENSSDDDHENDGKSAATPVAGNDGWAQI